MIRRRCHFAQRSSGGFSSMTQDDKERLFLDLLPLIRQRACVAARRFGGDREELIQECCLEAWGAIEKFDASRGLKLWTFIGACVQFRLLRDWSYRKAKSRAWVQLANLPDSAAPIEDSGGSQIEFEAMLRPLNAVEREVITGLYRDGRTLKEIGEKRGVTPQCISLIARRSIKRIRNFFLSKGVSHAHD